MKFQKLMVIFFGISFTAYSMQQTEKKREEETKLYQDKNNYTIDIDNLKKLPGSLFQEIMSYKLKDLRAAFEFTHPFKSYFPSNISSDCRYVMHTNSFGTGMYLSNLQTLAPLRAIDAKRFSLSELSSDGTILITIQSFYSAFEPDIIKIYNVRTGEVIHTINNYRNVFSIKISSNNKYALIKCSQGAIVLNIQTGQPAHPAMPPYQQVSSIAITPNGTKAILGSVDGTVRVLDVETEQNLLTIHHNDNDVAQVENTPFAMDTSNKYVATGFGDSIKIWDIETGNLLKSSNHQNEQVVSVTISPDNKYIIANCVNNDTKETLIKVLRIETNTVVYTDKIKNSYGKTSISWDNKYIIFYSGAKYPQSRKLWVLPEEQIKIIKSLSVDQLTLVTNLCLKKEMQKRESVDLTPKQQKIFESLPDFMQTALKENCDFVKTFKKPVLNKALKKVKEMGGSFVAIQSIGLMAMLENKALSALMLLVLIILFPRY